MGGVAAFPVVAMRGTARQGKASLVGGGAVANEAASMASARMVVATLAMATLVVVSAVVMEVDCVAASGVAARAKAAKAGAPVAASGAGSGFQAHQSPPQAKLAVSAHWADAAHGVAAETFGHGDCRAPRVPVPILSTPFAMTQAIQPTSVAMTWAAAEIARTAAAAPAHLLPHLLLVARSAGSDGY